MHFLHLVCLIVCVSRSHSWGLGGMKKEGPRGNFRTRVFSFILYKITPFSFSYPRIPHARQRVPCAPAAAHFPCTFTQEKQRKVYVVVTRSVRLTIVSIVFSCTRVCSSSSFAATTTLFGHPLVHRTGEDPVILESWVRAPPSRYPTTTTTNNDTRTR